MKKIIFLLILGLLSLTVIFNRQQFFPNPAPLKNSPAAPDYLIVLVGDSMTEALGNSTELRNFMKDYYPNKTFDFLNYGFGSTNILSLPNRLINWTEYGRAFQPILDINFKLIIIESFAYNPLSQYPLAEGLQKQTETLDQVVKLIKKRKPTAKIAFLATISPNSKRYGQGSVDLSPTQRQQWSGERVAYLKNHIHYANSHQIPLINVFEKSLDSLGDGNLEYIEKKTYIHPSPSGIIFISREIADFIYQNKLLD